MSKEKIFQVLPERTHSMGTTILLAVPNEIAQHFESINVKRVVCTINELHQFHCAINSRGDAGYYVMMSKRLHTTFDLDYSQMLTVKLAADESEYGFPVPLEWEEVLAIDEEVAEIFKDLTPGRQRSILHLVSAAKREETRITRALKIAENLKMGVRDPQRFLRNN